MTALTYNRSAVQTWLPTHKILLLIAAQGILSLAVDNVSALAVLYPAVLLALGIGALVRRDTTRVLFIVAYAATAEVIFRITRAPIFYESGKYLLVILLGGVLIQILPRCRGLALPFVIFAGVLPSAALTLMGAGLSVGRQLVVATTVGVLVLALSLAVFSNLRTTGPVFERLLWTMVVGISGTATLATFGTIRAGEISFRTQSNFATSAGYGPVQVSALLGLGALLCLILATGRAGIRDRLLPLALLVWFATQSVLTFSRGGLAVLVIAGGVFILHRVWDPHRRGGLLAVLVVVAVAGVLVAPKIDRFTGGLAEKRFSEVQTGRTTLAEQDLRIWREHPWTGVGPGMSRTDRAELSGTSSHTEYTRLLAEHGVFGLVSLLALVTAAVLIYVRARRRDRPHAAALLTWCLAHMAYANLRIAAASLVFGLAALRVEPAPREEPDTGESALVGGPAVARPHGVRR